MNKRQVEKIIESELEDVLSVVDTREWNRVQKAVIEGLFEGYVRAIEKVAVRNSNTIKKIKSRKGMYRQELEEYVEQALGNDIWGVAQELTEGKRK